MNETFEFKTDLEDIILIQILKKDKSFLGDGWIFSEDIRSRKENEYDIEIRKNGKSVGIVKLFSEFFTGEQSELDSKLKQL